MLSICQKRRQRSKPQAKKRLMRSTGHNIVTVGVPDKHWKYLSDLYTTLIDIKWRWNILIFVGGFVLAWFFFACWYYLLGYMHGDMDEDRNSTFVPCIHNVDTFTGAYLFSIETMTTIGYGYRSQTEACPEVYLLVMLQSIVGAGLQFMLASIVVSKTRRAKRRSESILFSNNVCIYEQDSKLQLAIRIADMRKSEIVGAHAQGYLVKKYKSKNGTYVPVRSYQVTFKGESGRDDIFFPWPTHILHMVDEDSPVWTLSRDELLKGKYELIVVIDGVSGATSRPFQARKSYHTFEMSWGHRFADIGLQFSSSGSYVMDLNSFHLTVPTNTPLCSAQDITHFRGMFRSNQSVPNASECDTPIATPSARRHNIAHHGSTPSLGAVTPKAGDKKGNEKEVRHPSTLPKTQRSRSVEEPVGEKCFSTKRRCSLGDMIRVAQGRNLGKKNLCDALNIYRHRRSVTDTYLGAEIEEEMEEEDTDSSLAIMTVVSQRSAERRADVRDIFKRRRSSVRLLFGGETSSAEDAEDDMNDSNQLIATVPSQKSPARHPNVKDIFKHRRGSVQLMFGSEKKSSVSPALLEEYDV